MTGHGGAGFPAIDKLSVALAAGHGGLVVVNGMEGEPASDKDKLLLLRSPHLVLEQARSSWPRPSAPMACGSASPKGSTKWRRP